jgi:hypothetical protein
LDLSLATGNYWEYTPKYELFNSLKDSNPELKTLIAVGGWTFSQSRFVYAASTPTTRANASQLLTFLLSMASMGLTLIGNTPSLDKELLLTMATTLCFVRHYEKRSIVPDILTG